MPSGQREELAGQAARREKLRVGRGEADSEHGGANGLISRRGRCRRQPGRQAPQNVANGGQRAFAEEQHGRRSGLLPTSPSQLAERRQLAAKVGPPRPILSSEELKHLTAGEFLRAAHRDAQGREPVEADSEIRVGLHLHAIEGCPGDAMQRVRTSSQQSLEPQLSRREARRFQRARPPTGAPYQGGAGVDFQGGALGVRSRRCGRGSNGRCLRHDLCRRRRESWAVYLALAWRRRLPYLGKLATEEAESRQGPRRRPSDVHIVQEGHDEHIGEGAAGGDHGWLHSGGEEERAKRVPLLHARDGVNDVV